MADDLGYADLSCYGRRDFETPFLDGLASEGVRLTHSYSNSPVCSPTRVALITGRYQYRLPAGLEEPIVGDRVGLPTTYPTLPSLLKAAGYRTALVGKWHLGSLPDHSPLQSGYDDFFGIFGGAADYFKHSPDARNPLYEDEVAVERVGYMTDLLGERAVAEIEQAANGDAPLFLSLHFTAPHWPWEGPQDRSVSGNVEVLPHWEGGSPETYADMVRSLDTNVGRVLNALAATGMAENTVVVFTSDNGGERFSDVWPFIGVKGELLEGGIRVPTIVRWPSRIEAGTTSDQAMISMDWVPTLLRVAGASADPDYPLDGVDLLDVLTGAVERRPRKLYWRFNIYDQRALRDGNWKYLRIGGNEFLFDLIEDPRERANRKDASPSIFRRLKADYEAWDEQMLPYTSENGTPPPFADIGVLADRY